MPSSPRKTHHSPRLRLMVLLGGGGWHRETVRLLEQFDPTEFDYLYVYGHHSGNHACRYLPTPHPGPRIPMHYLGPTRKTLTRFITNPLRFFISFFEALNIIRRTRPDLVLALGSAMAVPLLAAARIFRARTVFLESLTRVETLSLTGRIVHALRLADRFYVQWSKLADRFPRATFAGAVL